MVIDQEKKIIKMSMIVLSLALIVIYVLLYYVKGKDLIETVSKKPTIQTGKVDNEIKILVKTGNVQKEIVANTGIKNSNNTQTNTGNGNNNLNLTSLTGNSTGYGFNNNIKDTIKILSGTHIYYKTIESIEKLGIGYKYILTDEKQIYYVFLGTGKINYDIPDIVKRLGGSLYEIKTEQEIIQNKLFGDKVTYINFNEYKNNTVLMWVEIDSENWIIQINYEIYHKSKSYLQSLFQ